MFIIIKMDVDNKNLDRIIDKCLDFPMYHGTSSVCLPQILQVGLSPDDRPWDKSKMEELNRLLIKGGWKYGVHPSYSRNKNRLHLTSEHDRAVLFAKIAPEVWHFIKKDGVSCIHRNRLTSAENQRVDAIYKDLETFFSGSKPVVVHISNHSPPVREEFRRALQNWSEGIYEDDTLFSLYSRQVINELALVDVSAKIDPKYILKYEYLPQK